MQLRYAFRLYPDAAQQAALARAFGCARVVFNDAVRAREDARKAEQPFPTAGQLSRKLLTEAKRTAERSWLGEVSAVVLQQSLRDAETAYRNFFASLKGTRKGPKVRASRLKSRKDARQSIRFTANARWNITDSGRLNLPKIGKVKVKWSRTLPATPTSVTVVQDAAGRFFASFVIDTDPAADAMRMPQTDCTIGIDLGLTLPQRGCPHRGPVRRHEDRLPALSAARREEAEEGPEGTVPQAEGIEEPGQGPPQGRSRPHQSC
ncbi:RNA-guided endonuclease InsQ/TnpB family protein [Streptomyces sp. NPDC050121]|uniref:RNA-guided endonuclease InsQ/TnpB family protein n=1 Tax=Streptomyces sp. NPDC050121 TaxID=3365601 RepID=UPI00379849A8